MNGCIFADSALSPQRLHSREEPSFVLSVCDNNFARPSSRFSFGPHLHSGAKFRGTVVVSVEQNQNRLAAWLTDCDSDSFDQTVLFHEEATGLPNRFPYLDIPASGRPVKPSKQDGQRLHFAVTLNDWLDLHEGTTSNSFG